MRVGSRVAALITALTVAVLGPPATATANAETDLPAIGSITISDYGFGPHTTWTYVDGVDLTCTSSTTGPNGVPQTVTVRCVPGQTFGRIFACPVMLVQRTTSTIVGARASCADMLDMGVGTTALAFANLGHITTALTCEAYVDVGVLTPPYSVTCSEPGPPTIDTSSLAATATG